MMLKPEETKAKFYAENEEIVNLSVELIMTNPPADKVLDILKTIGATGYGQGMADGAEYIADMAKRGRNEE